MEETQVTEVEVEEEGALTLQEEEVVEEHVEI